MKQCLMLVGRSGSGKTSVMETLLGSEVKNAREIQSVTRFGPEIQVKETYGFFSNMQNLQCCIQDIESCIQSFSGIDVIGLVIRIGRFTLEERDMIEIFRDTLGEGALNFTVVIFTNLDNLLYDDVSLSEFLADSPKQLQDLLSLCSGSYVCFDNKGPEADRQGYAKSLIEAMKDLKERNMSARYTYDMMEIAMKAKMVKDEEKAKTEEDNAHVFRERAKLDMRAEVEAKVRRELVQEKIQLANRARLLEENKINKESWKTGSEDTGHVRTIFSQHVGDHGGKALQNMPLKDQRRGGLEHTQPPKDQGRNRREDRGYTDDHWTSGREDRGYIKDHLTSGRKNRSYSEDHGWSEHKDRRYVKDDSTSGHEYRGYTEDQGRSGREDRGNIKDYWTSGREDRGYTEDQGRSGREDRGNIKDYWRSGREDRGYTEDQGRSGREDRGNIKDYWRSGREGRGYRQDNGRSGLWDRRCRERGIKGETESQRSNQALPILGTQTTLDFSKNKTNHYFVPRSRDDPSNDKIDVNQRPNPRTQHSTMSPNGAPKIAPKPNRLKLNEKAKSENPTDAKTVSETTEVNSNMASRGNTFVQSLIWFWNHL